MYLNDRPDGGLQVVPLRLGRVEDLDGMRPPGHVHEGRAVKVVLELAGVQRGAHDDQLQVGPAWGAIQ